MLQDWSTSLPDHRRKRGTWLPNPRPSAKLHPMLCVTATVRRPGGGSGASKAVTCMTQIALLGMCHCCDGISCALYSEHHSHFYTDLVQAHYLVMEDI